MEPFAVNTATQEEYDLLMQWAKERKLKWSSGTVADELQIFHRYKGKTVISLMDGDRGMSYGDGSLYTRLSKEYEIVDFADFATEYAIAGVETLLPDDFF